MKREDLGSWLNGRPGDQAYPGEHLGRPQTGPGAIAHIGRRILAFIIDWYLCWGLMALIGMGGSSIADNLGLIILVWVYQIVCVGLMGHTLGHFIFGMQVQTLDGYPAGWLAALARATLVMLVLPVAVMDRDQRGIHDRVRNTVLVCIR